MANLEKEAKLFFLQNRQSLLQKIADDEEKKEDDNKTDTETVENKEETVAPNESAGKAPRNPVPGCQPG